MNKDTADEMNSALSAIIKASWRKDTDIIQQQFSNSVSYMPQVIETLTKLGFEGVKDASVHLDTQHATDLVDSDDRHIAVRVREAAYKKYAGEFTIRSRYPKDYPGDSSKTELRKILEGAGDLVFYGFVNNAGTLDSWVLLDLAVFRETLAGTGMEYSAARFPKTFTNVTDKITFSVYKINNFPAEFVLMEG